jgi:hypothetical protein
MRSASLLVLVAATLVPTSARAVGEKVGRSTTDTATSWLLVLLPLFRRRRHGA